MYCPSSHCFLRDDNALSSILFDIKITPYHIQKPANSYQPSKHHQHPSQCPRPPTHPHAPRGLQRAGSAAHACTPTGPTRTWSPPSRSGSGGARTRTSCTEASRRTSATQSAATGCSGTSSRTSHTPGAGSVSRGIGSRMTGRGISSSIGKVRLGRR